MLNSVALVGFIFCILAPFSQTMAGPRCTQVFQKRALTTSATEISSLIYSPVFYLATSRVETATSKTLGQDFHFLGARNLTRSDYRQLAEATYEKIGKIVRLSSYESDERYLYSYINTPKNEVIEDIETALVSLSLVEANPIHTSDVQVRLKEMPNEYGEQYISDSLGFGSIAMSTGSIFLIIGAASQSSAADTMGFVSIGAAVIAVASIAGVPVVKRIYRNQKNAEEKKLRKANTEMLLELWDRSLKAKENLLDGELRFTPSSILEKIDQIDTETPLYGPVILI